EGCVQSIGTHERARGSAQEGCTNRTSRRDTASQCNQLPQRWPIWHLIEAGAGDVTRDAKELRSRGTPRADAGVGLSSLQNNRRDIHQCLDVIDRCRFAEKTDIDGKRRLVSRFAAFAFDGVEQSGLLTANVGAGPAADLHLKAEARAEDVRPQQPGSTCGLDG